MAIDDPNLDAVLPAGDAKPPETAIKPDPVKDVQDVEAVLHNPTQANVAATAEDFAALALAGPAIVSETRRGWKTSEFWVGIAAVAQAVATSLPQTDKIAILGLAAVYGLARGIAKNGVPEIGTPSPAVEPLSVIEP